MRTLKISRKAFKFLQNLQEPLRGRVDKAILSIRQSSLSPGVVKLKGSTDFYRIRVGDYRIIYSFDADEIYIDAIAHRRESYR